MDWEAEDVCAEVVDVTPLGTIYPTMGPAHWVLIEVKTPISFPLELLSGIS